MTSDPMRITSRRRWLAKRFITLMHLDVAVRLSLPCLQLPHDFVTPRRRCRELCATQRHPPHFPGGSMRELGAAHGAALLAPGRRELPRQTGASGRASRFVRPAFIALRYFHRVTRVVDASSNASAYRVDSLVRRHRTCQGRRKALEIDRQRWLRSVKRC